MLDSELPIQGCRSYAPHYCIRSLAKMITYSMSGLIDSSLHICSSNLLHHQESSSVKTSQSKKVNVKFQFYTSKTSCYDVDCSFSNLDVC